MKVERIRKLGADLKKYSVNIRIREQQFNRFDILDF